MMFKLSAKETAMAERLRQEALAVRPAFSEDLHARLCAALQSCPADAARPRPSASGRWFRWAPAAAAAAGLLLAVGVTWIATKTQPDAGPAGSGSAGNSDYLALRGTPGLGKAHRKADVRSMTELVGQMSSKFDGFVDSAVKAPRRYYLDRNLRLALQMPVVRVPMDIVSSLLSMGSQKHPRPVPPTDHS
jgi:hypothetical protein